MAEDLERRLRRIQNHRAKSEAERESLSQEIENLKAQIEEQERKIASEHESHGRQLEEQQNLLSDYEKTLEGYKERLNQREERPSYPVVSPSYQIPTGRPKKSLDLDNRWNRNINDDEPEEKSSDIDFGGGSSDSDRDSSEDYSLPSVSEVREKLKEFRARDGKLGKMVGLSLGLLGPIAAYKGFKLNSERREYLANLRAKCNAASGRDASEILELIERGYDELKEDNKFKPMGSKDDD